MYIYIYTNIIQYIYIDITSMQIYASLYCPFCVLSVRQRACCGRGFCSTRPNETQVLLLELILSDDFCSNSALF